MSKFRSKRLAKNKQLDRRRTRRRDQSQREAEERALVQKDEPEKEIWNITGVKYPGSPGRSSDEAETKMLDVRGRTVSVALRKRQVFKLSGARKAEATVWTPIAVPELWTGDMHHRLTHALRLLQVFSGLYGGKSKPRPLFVLRGKVEPTTLLCEWGAGRPLAEALFALLTEHGLLQHRSMELGDKPRWIVNMRTKGFGPDLQQYSIDDMPELVLPEFSVPLEPAASIQTTEREDEMEAAVEEPVSELLLLELYEWLGRKAQEDVVSEGDGVVVFKTDGAPDGLFAKEKDISGSSSRGYLNRLIGLEVYESKRGANPDRRLRTDEAARKKVMEAAGVQQSPPQTEPGQFRPNDRDFLNRVYKAALQKILDLRENVANLEAELLAEQGAHAETRAKLEEATARLEELEKIPMLDEDVVRGLLEQVGPLE